MIKLTRRVLAPALHAKIEERVEMLRAHIANGENPPETLLNAYRDPEVKQHLVVEAYGKCMYCESKITHVYFGDVEHIKPKSLFPEDRLSIENLGLACALCNNAKGDFWDAATPLLNPYEDNPTVELLAFGYMIVRRPGKDRARVSIEQLGLNRQALLERRKERIELLQPLVDQFSLTPEGAVKKLIQGELTRQAGSDGEYALVVRAFLEAACGLDFSAAVDSKCDATSVGIKE